MIALDFKNSTPTATISINSHMYAYILADASSCTSSACICQGVGPNCDPLPKAVACRGTERGIARSLSSLVGAGVETVRPAAVQVRFALDGTGQSTPAPCAAAQDGGGGPASPQGWTAARRQYAVVLTALSPVLPGAEGDVGAGVLARRSDADGRRRDGPGGSREAGQEEELRAQP